MINQEPVAPEEVKIHVVIPFYNCNDYMYRNLKSVLDQEHPNFDVVMVDDDSNDGSSWKAEGICKEMNWIYHRNEQNKKCPYNIMYAVRYLLNQADPNDVIFLLDGDDYLPHSKVLTRIGELFAEANIWMTYGQYMSDPPDWQCAPAIAPPYDSINKRNFRQVSCFFNHPIVFRKFLFDSIPLSEFQDDEGNWFEAGYDRTIIYPLMERATPIYGEQPHWRFINEIMYVYNSINPNSEWRVVPREAMKVDMVHTRPYLEPLGV